ncbi:DUF2716 domain-containing protein [Streptomyces sp. NPDC050448]|uniref:DUF2716 domain-containing protein n=1 Tax=Streptomyces sp. NPDC050448 TaxID=3155404 RepID=UPI00344774D8
MDRLEQARLLGAYTAQLRGRVPERPPTGAVVEQDGPFVRTHYGTHGTVGHRPLAHTPRADLAGLVRRQREAFAARGEGARWKVYGEDPPGLAEELAAAGFTADAPRSLLVADLARLAPGRDPELRSVWGLRADSPWRALAAASGPHAKPFAELEADRGWRCDPGDVSVLIEHGRVVAAGWMEIARGTDFMLVGGLTDPSTAAAFVRHWAPLGAASHHRRRAAAYCAAEAEGELRTALLATGFAELTTVRTFRLDPAGTPARTRPVRELAGSDEDVLWDRLRSEFGFRTKVVDMPGFAAPGPSATWPLGDPEEELTDALDGIVLRGLTAVTPAGEQVCWLDWQHPCYAFDPHRVGGPGEPECPGQAYPDGDFYLYVDPGLRFGTFGHPWEHTLTVFGGGLLGAVEAGLTALLGEPVRRRG